MSKGLFRHIDTNFWIDIKVSEELSAKERYFFLYLLTNPSTNLIGCYELGLKKAAIDTDLPIDDIKSSLDKLKELHMVEYDEKTKEVLLLNWLKHNLTANEKMQAAVSKQLLEVKSKAFYEILAKKITEISKQLEPKKPKPSKEKSVISLADSIPI